MILGKPAEAVESGVEETLCYMCFLREHWRNLRTNNPLERAIREILRRTRVVGSFPDGNNARMKAMENEHPITGLCEVFGVSRSGASPLA